MKRTLPEKITGGLCVLMMGGLWGLVAVGGSVCNATRSTSLVAMITAG
jgi:hypothetical protein